MWVEDKNEMIKELKKEKTELELNRGKMIRRIQIHLLNLDVLLKEFYNF